MEEKSSTMSLIGLGLSGFTRRLSIPEVELPFGSRNTRRRQNASISLPSSSGGSQSSFSSQSTTYTHYQPEWATAGSRPSLTPLLSGAMWDDSKERYYDGDLLDTRRRSRGSHQASSAFLTSLSKQSLIGLIYLVLFGLVILTYFTQNGVKPSLEAYDTLNKIQSQLGIRSAAINGGNIQKTGEEMTIEWSDDRRVNTTLPKPYDGYRWTYLHANVMENNGTSKTKLEMLTFIEATPPKRQIGWWQLTLPHIPDVVSSATCRFGTAGQQGETRTPASMEWDFKRAPFQSARARWALLISCDVPQDYLARSSQSHAPSSASLELLLADQTTTFTQAISLQSTPLSKNLPSGGSLGICVAPMYGPASDKKMLEWRLHHLILGVDVVHWYDRDGRGRTREWVRELKRLYKVHDTYTAAPCISPESCGVEGVLEDKGVSGDQVLYYADCLARSRHTYPTEWLAMMDVDEYLFATSENSTLGSFLSSQDANTAALAFERYIAPSEPVVASSSSPLPTTSQTGPPSLILDTIQTLATPGEIDRHDNTKMLYRTSALKLAWVHWEVAFRADQPAQAKKKLESMDQGMIMVHVSGYKGRGPFKTAFNVRERMLHRVESVRDRYRAMIGKLPWLAQ